MLITSTGEDGQHVLAWPLIAAVNSRPQGCCILTLTASCCQHWWVPNPNLSNTSKLPRYWSLYWLTWWMLAASIILNCCISTRLIRSTPQMSFVSRLLEPSYHGNSCHGNAGQIKGSNLAFAEIGGTSIVACVKIRPYPTRIQTHCVWIRINKMFHKELVRSRHVFYGLNWNPTAGQASYDPQGPIHC